MSSVTCHQRKQPQPQTLPLLTPPLCTLHNRPRQNPKTQINLTTQKIIATFKRISFYLISLFLFDDTLSDQKSPTLSVWVAYRGDQLRRYKIQTDIATYRLNWPRGQFSGNE